MKVLSLSLLYAIDLLFFSYNDKKVKCTVCSYVSYQCMYICIYKRSLGRTDLIVYIYLAGDIVVVQLSPIPHQQNSMLETVNTCMTSVYICMLSSIIYKFSSLTLFDAWLLDNICVPPRCSWRVKKVHTSIIICMWKKRRGTFVYLFSFCKWQHHRYILRLLRLIFLFPLSMMRCPRTYMCICHLIIFQL